jgi:hypothetical protein
MAVICSKSRHSSQRACPSQIFRRIAHGAGVARKIFAGYFRAVNAYAFGDIYKMRRSVKSRADARLSCDRVEHHGSRALPLVPAI